MPSLSVLLRLSGLVAAVLFVMSVLGFAVVLDGYAQARHPVALLGAQGLPHALAFNLLGFVAPGLLAVLATEGLRRNVASQAGWAGRVGCQMLVLAGLAFAGMGLAPLDVNDLDGPASQLHASAWMVWILAFVVGALMLGFTCLGDRQGRALGALAVACAAVAAVAAFGLNGLVPAPLSQRVAFACWVVWLAAAAYLSQRTG